MTLHIFTPAQPSDVPFRVQTSFISATHTDRESLIRTNVFTFKCTSCFQSPHQRQTYGLRVEWHFFHSQNALLGISTVRVCCQMLRNLKQCEGWRLTLASDILTPVTDLRKVKVVKPSWLCVCDKCHDSSKKHGHSPTITRYNMWTVYFRPHIPGNVAVGLSYCVSYNYYNGYSCISCWYILLLLVQNI